MLHGLAAKSSEESDKSGRSDGTGGKRKHELVCSALTTFHLVLQTFWITVNGPKGQRRVRVLLDGRRRGNLSYITHRAASQLSLVSTGSEVQSVCVFDRGVDDQTMYKIKLEIKTNHTNDISALRSLRLANLFPPCVVVFGVT